MGDLWRRAHHVNCCSNCCTSYFQRLLTRWAKRGKFKGGAERIRTSDLGFRKS